MRRHPAPVIALAALAALLGAGCGSSRSDACPGETIGAFALSGTRNLAPDPEAPAIPACPAETGYGDAPISFFGTLSSDSETSGAAFCSGRPLAATLFGQRSGDAVDVEATTRGAVLGGCGPTCSAELTVILRGTVLRDGGGVATGFAGTYIERMSRHEGDCGACPLPCDARYDVTGALAP
ncbi:hypothetical protein [Anaeromyxobacter oryzae]|uniref:Lipoprotein n=1 Tax=Anaeromyxobacter oryzae TaxID=2918170 RepID=A0ABM7WTA9_9BACT|nr:hypothetical protein [Anaeromyxobacter oryzae]BDG02735.1 hypothetical protein AMOR_17310 [Anaeromyxobacter oryzae]